MRRLASLGPFVVLALAPVEGSQCLVAYSFEQRAREVNLVVAVKVVRHEPSRDTSTRHWPRFMDVEVIRVVAGDEQRQTLRVWGMNRSAFDTRVGIASLPVGTYWLLDLNRLKRSVPESDITAGDYTLIDCGIGEKRLAQAADALSPSVDQLAAEVAAHRTRSNRPK